LTEIDSFLKLPSGIKINVFWPDTWNLFPFNLISGLISKQAIYTENDLASSIKHLTKNVFKQKILFLKKNLLRPQSRWKQGKFPHFSVINTMKE